MLRAATAVLCMAAFTLPAAAADYVTVPGGSYSSVLPPDGKFAPAVVAAFRLRTLPVTNGEFLDFVRANPQWARFRIASLFADGQYLSHWAGPLSLGGAGRNQPVTHVSWFAAEAYCESEQARLPTWYEFEYAAASDESHADARGDEAWREHILDWYSRPSTTALPDVGSTPKNFQACVTIVASR